MVFDFQGIWYTILIYFDEPARFCILKYGNFNL